MFQHLHHGGHHETPEKVRDLLAYSSIVVKASEEFEDTPWLEYEVRFRKEAAVNPSKSWAVVDPSSWTLCFSAAKPQLPQTRAKAVTKEEKCFHPFRSNEVCRNYNHRCYRKECQLCVQHARASITQMTNARTGSQGREPQAPFNHPSKYPVSNKETVIHRELHNPQDYRV